MLGHWGGTNGAGQFGKELPGRVYPAACAGLCAWNNRFLRRARLRRPIWNEDQIYSSAGVTHKYEAVDCRRLAADQSGSSITFGLTFLSIFDLKPTDFCEKKRFHACVINRLWVGIFLSPEHGSSPYLFLARWKYARNHHVDTLKGRVTQKNAVIVQPHVTLHSYNFLLLKMFSRQH